DFTADAEAVRKVINTWVAEQTRDRIKNLLPEKSLDSLTRLVLVNAVYFKGVWAQAFDKAETKPQAFFVDGKESVELPLMFRKMNSGYLKGDDYQALELPYQGNRLGMVVFLPDAKDGLAAFEKKMTGEGLSKLLGMLQHEKDIQVYLPKFTFSWGGGMKEHLQALGMKVPFEDNADFSGMTGKPDLKIDQVYHQAFVEVNEEGTEAAAATAVVMTEKGISFEIEPKLFRADHPFLFLIRDRETGTVLFMGRVTDPRK
ncbi:MAG TPA: serpin family protein, partial [Candidatus Ozemobacteraceae bacterium]|nr:serpin family protein [Candidatus Ozemobacteraceae bacterium]